MARVAPSRSEEVSTVVLTDNMARQRELYGASIGECLHRITGCLGLSQAAVARAAGISAPMLSQLASGHRIKIGNPHAAARFFSLLQLVDEVETGLAHEQVATRVAEISQEETTPLTGTREVTSTTGEQPDVAAAVSGVLRAVASGRDLAAAAAALQEEHPGIAEVLRAYGTGSPADARRHHASIAHLG